MNTSQHILARDLKRKDKIIFNNIEYHILQLRHCKGARRIEVTYAEKIDQHLWITEIDNVILTFPEKVISKIIVSLLPELITRQKFADRFEVDTDWVPIKSRCPLEQKIKHIYNSNSSSNRMIIAYTDGSCLGNPGKGGWGVILLVEEKEFIFSGSDKETTNNRMELLAAIVALEKSNELNPMQNEQITIHSDSQYVCNGISVWMSGWRRKNWKTTNGTAVKNQDLWKQLDKYKGNRIVICKWVKGHSTDEMNNRVDLIARSEANKI